LEDGTPYQLWVVFTEDMNGASADTWAEQTATESQLGTDDLLLAVDVEDRAFSLAASDDSGLSSDQLQSVRSDIEDQLGDDDWAGAVVAATEAIASAESGTAVDGGDGAGGGGFPLGFVVFLVIAGGITLAIWASSRKNKRAQAEA